jgi:hypothetical protein
MGFLMDLSSKPKQSFAFCMNSPGRVDYSLWRAFMFLEIPEMHELAMASRSSPGRVEARRGELVASGYSSF